MPFTLKNGKTTDFNSLKNALAKKPGIMKPAAMAAMIEKHDTGMYPGQRKRKK